MDRTVQPGVAGAGSTRTPTYIRSTGIEVVILDPQGHGGRIDFLHEATAPLRGSLPVTVQLSAPGNAYRSTPDPSVSHSRELIDHVVALGIEPIEHRVTQRMSTAHADRP